MAELSPHTLTVSDDTGHTLIFDTEAIGAAIRSKALAFLQGDMSHETQLKRALVSTFLRTGQGMVSEMARSIAPDAPPDAFARVKGEDIMEWFAGVLAALTTYALPAQSPIVLATQAPTLPTQGAADGDEGGERGDGEERRGNAIGGASSRLVVAVALAARPQRAASSAGDSGTLTARTAI